MRTDKGYDIPWCRPLCLMRIIHLFRHHEHIPKHVHYGDILFMWAVQKSEHVLYGTGELHHVGVLRWFNSNEWERIEERTFNNKLDAWDYIDMNLRVLKA